jgi:D-alanine-D-alanine ligase
MSGARPRAAVLYNAPSLPADHPHFDSEADVVAVAREIVAILDRSSFHATLIAAAPPIERLIHDLTNPSPGVVFNLIEGFAGASAGEAWITSLLQLLGLPYTGCPPEAQGLCHQKARTKALLRGFGLPTAPFLVVAGRPPSGLPFAGPYFVKPDAEDASLGIDQASVVADAAGLSDRVAMLRSRFPGDILIEAYLPGPEYNVGVLGLPEPTALAVAEVVYNSKPGDWPILTYAAKWDVGSAEDLASPIRCPAVVDEPLAGELRRLAVAAFEATGCRDVARVDFRLDAEGRPMILEVNPNPDLGSAAGWARALRASGRDYAETIVGLAEQALIRGPRRG